MSVFEILIVVLLTVLVAAVLVVIDGRLVTAWRKRSISPEQREAVGEPTFGILAAGEYKVLDGDGNAKYFKTADGGGTSGDAWIPQHTETNSTAMAASLAALDNAVSGNELQVDVLTMPTVAVTQSGTWDEVGINDSGNSITVDDGGSSLTVDNGGTFAVQVSSALPAGTNAIGKLAANSGVDIGDVDVTSIVLPLGGGKTILTAAGTCSSSGNNTLVSAPGAGAIYVFGYALQAQGTVTAIVQDGAGGTAKSASWSLQAREGVAREINPPGYLFKCSATTLLNLNLSGAVTVGYEINYWVE